MKIQYSGTYIYNGDTGSGTTILGPISIDTSDLSCLAIQEALNDIKAPDSYPVDCSFIDLTSTGVVFFMDPINQQLVESIEVTIPNSNKMLTEEDIKFFYIIEVSLIMLFTIIVIMLRQFKKFPGFNNLFDN